MDRQPILWKVENINGILTYFPNKLTNYNKNNTREYNFNNIFEFLSGFIGKDVGSIIFEYIFAFNKCITKIDIYYMIIEMHTNNIIKNVKIFYNLSYENLENKDVFFNCSITDYQFKNTNMFYLGSEMEEFSSTFGIWLATFFKTMYSQKKHSFEIIHNTDIRGNQFILMPHTNLLKYGDEIFVTDSGASNSTIHINDHHCYYGKNNDNNDNNDNILVIISLLKNIIKITDSKRNKLYFEDIEKHIKSCTQDYMFIFITNHFGYIRFFDKKALDELLNINDILFDEKHTLDAEIIFKNTFTKRM